MMYRTFKTKQQFNDYTDSGKSLECGDLYLIDENKTVVFITNNLNGMMKTNVFSQGYNVSSGSIGKQLIYGRKYDTSENMTTFENYKNYIIGALISDNYTQIASNAFDGCTSMKYIIVLNPTPPSLYGSFFDSSTPSELKIYVPDESVDAYKAATNWKSYANQIVGLSMYVPDESNKQQLIYGSTYNLFDNSNFYSIVSYYVDSVFIPDSVTTIGENAFSELETLTSINIPDSVITIDSYAFCNCYGLTSANIGNGVKVIGTYAFSNCYSLASINIPDSVTTIGEFSFTRCSSLESVNVGNGVTTIGTHTFSNCTDLTSINMSDSVTKIDSYAFSNCYSLASINIPDSDTNIGFYAFSNCSSLTSINIPDSVINIGEFAFSECSSLTSANIGNGVKVIKDSTFKNCSNLQFLELGSGVTTIESNVLGSGSVPVQTLKVHAVNPPTLGGLDFLGQMSQKLKIYVPDESVDAYKAADYWSEKAEKIFGLSTYPTE